MKEKKMIASVILGVALVSLITALVAGLAEGLTFLVDPSDLSRTYDEDYNYLVGGLTIAGVLIGIAFAATFLANKKYRFAVNLGLAVALVLYCIITIIVTRAMVPCYTLNGLNILSQSAYELYSSYLPTAITVMMSAALTFAAWLYLTRLKKKEETVQNQPETDVHE